MQIIKKKKTKQKIYNVIAYSLNTMHFQMNFKDGISLKCSALCSNKKKKFIQSCILDGFHWYLLLLNNSEIICGPSYRTNYNQKLVISVMLFSFNVLYQFITRIFESLTSTMHLVQTIQEKSQYLHIHYFDCEFDSLPADKFQCFGVLYWEACLVLICLQMLLLWVCP